MVMGQTCTVAIASTAKEALTFGCLVTVGIGSVTHNFVGCNILSSVRLKFEISTNVVEVLAIYDLGNQKTFPLFH